MIENFIGQSCKIPDLSPLPDDPTPTMSYIPYQQWSTTYDELQAFENGTLYPDLDKPFYGHEVRK